MNYPIAKYKELLSLPNDAEFTRIDHEDAIVAIVYRITKPDGSELILKICSRSPDYYREIYFLKYFSGTLPVPQIIDVAEPGADIHGAILMQCFPGTLLQATELREHLSYELGSVLARIHLNRMSAYGDPIEPDNLNPDPRVYFNFKFAEGLSECKDHLPDALLDHCRRYYDSNINLLKSVDGPCVVHRDFRPGNIIIQNGVLQGIIDWASARSSFAEEDFCSLELGEWSRNLANKKSFLLGYASIRSVPDYETIMPFLQLNKAIATIGFTVKRGTWNNSSSGLYNINREFLDNFF